MIVDPGPSSCLETLLAGLEGEPRGLLLTHIHLDHAGASGSLVERFPKLRVYVHEVGAPHLVDPQKLLESASRLYGDDMERLWGEVLPVPASSVVALSGGEEIEGFRVAHVPGHASHHVAYLHSRPATPTSGTWPACASLRTSSRWRRRRRRTSTSRRGSARSTRSPNGGRNDSA